MAAETAKFDLSRTYLRYAPMVVRRLRDLHADEQEIREALKHVFVAFLQEREHEVSHRISETLLHLCDRQAKGSAAPKPDFSGEGFLLERHFAGETGAGDSAEVARLSRNDPSIARRLEILRRGSDEILSLYPPASLLSEIKHAHWKKLASKPSSVYGSSNPQNVKKGLYVIAGVAAVLILSTWLWEKNRGTYRITDNGKNKPGKAFQVNEIFVYQRTGLSEGQEKPIRNGQSVPAGSLLHIAYFSTNAAGVIFSIDPAGKLERLHPGPDKTPTPKRMALTPYEKMYLRDDYELSAKPGRETIFFVSGPSNLSFDEVWEGALRLAVKPELKGRAFSNYLTSWFDILRK